MDTTHKELGFISYQLTSPAGYSVKLSFQIDKVQTVDWNQVMANLTVAEEQFKQRGYVSQKPAAVGKFPSVEKEYVPERTCPKCGQKLVYATKKTDGTKFIKCSTTKWNFLTKTASGCDYVEWPKTTRPATERQKEIIEKLQFEGKVDLELDIANLTFEGASKILSDVKNARSVI